jgi:geranylgeranyl diphosphate synthase type I
MVEVIDNSLMEYLEAEIREVLSERSSPKKLYNIMRYHLGWLAEDLSPIEHYRGKRFRPMLCLLAYYSLSGVYDKAIPAAASIELIHNFSLIHDDIEDRDEERRRGSSGAMRRE